MAMKIDTVAPGSDAAALGLGPGDELLSVDGNAINDALDYQFYTDSPGFHLTARVAGGVKEWDVARQPGEDFGCNFATYLGDKKHSCANRCIFCCPRVCAKACISRMTTSGSPFCSATISP